MHLQKNVAFLHACLYSVFVMGGSIRFEEGVLEISIPSVFARYLAAPNIQSFLVVVEKDGRHESSFRTLILLIFHLYCKIGANTSLFTTDINSSFSSWVAFRCLAISRRHPVHMFLFLEHVIGYLMMLRAFKSRHLEA